MAQASFGAGNLTWCKVGHALLDDGLSQFASLVFVLAGASASYTEVTRVQKCLMQSELPCEMSGTD